MRRLLVAAPAVLALGVLALPEEQPPRRIASPIPTASSTPPISHSLTLSISHSHTSTLIREEPGGGPISATASGLLSPPARSPRDDLDRFLEDEVATVARELDLDRDTAARLRDLARRTFLSLVQEIEERLERPDLHDVSAEAIEDLVEARQRELHRRAEELLPPAKRARYRALAE